MNFIDKALNDISYGEGFLYAMQNGLRTNPEIRNELDSYPEWISIVVGLIDFVRDLHDNGLQNRSYQREAAILNKCHLTDDATIILQITEASSDGDVESITKQLTINRCEDTFWTTLFFYIDEELWDYNNPDYQYDL